MKKPALPFVVLCPLLAALAGCATATPSPARQAWQTYGSRDDARTLETDASALPEIAFADDPLPEDDPDPLFEADYVPERDVAHAEVLQRLAIAARDFDEVQGAMNVSAGVSGGEVTTMLSRARQQAVDAHEATEILRTASLPTWKSARALASAAVGTFEHSVRELGTLTPATAANAQ